MNITQIANAALEEHLGEQPIQDIGENSLNASIIRSKLEACKRELFDLTSWDFAYETAKLSLTDNQAAGLQYKYKYFLPANCMYLKIVDRKSFVESFNRNYNYMNLDDRADFRQVSDGAGRIIALSNVPDAYAVYYKEISDSEVWPIDFSNALAALLASKIALRITASVEKRNGAVQMFNFYKDQALAKSLNRQKPYRKRRVAEMIQDRLNAFIPFNRRHY